MNKANQLYNYYVPKLCFSLGIGLDERDRSTHIVLSLLLSSIPLTMKNKNIFNYCFENID